MNSVYVKIFHSKPKNVHLMVMLEKKSEGYKTEQIHPVGNQMSW